MDLSIALNATAANAALQPSLGACPKCGAAVHAHGTNYVCANSLVSPAQAVPSCDFKTGQVILQQAISAEQLSKLLTSGRTDLLDGFVATRTQKAFKAVLVWDAKAGKVGFEFPAVVAPLPVYDVPEYDISAMKVLDDNTIRVGQIVVHSKFGEGVVIFNDGRGTDARAQVNFVLHGPKWLALAIAKLRLVK